MAAARVMWIVNIALRVAQILFAIIVLGTSAYVVSNTSDYSSYYSPYYYYYGRKLMAAFSEELHAPARHLLAATTKGSAGFGVFTGLVGFLGAAFFLIMTLKPTWLKARAPKAMGITEAVVSGVFAIFFLAAAAAYASLGSCSSGTYCGNFNAAHAFSWLSFFVWTASTVFVLLEFFNVFPRAPKDANAGAAPKTVDAKPAPAPATGYPPQVYAQPTTAPTGYAPTGIAPVHTFPQQPAPANQSYPGAASPAQAYAVPTYVKTSDLPAASGPVIATREMDLNAPKGPDAA